LVWSVNSSSILVKNIGQQWNWYSCILKVLLVSIYILVMIKVPYISVVDSLIYVMVYTMPDITHIVGMVSQFLFNPGKEHWSTVKLILMYLKSTSSFNLYFGNGKHVLDGCIYAKMACDIKFKKSISGYLMTFARGSFIAIKLTKMYCIIYYRG